MENPNVEVVEGFIEQIFNQRQPERLSEFCEADAVSHAPAYVGLGVYFDDTSGEKLILTQIAPGSPADGHLQIGDELIRVRNEEQTWETFESLRKGFWTRGLVGSEVALTVRRHGNLLTIPLQLRKIDQFDIKLADSIRTMMPYLNQFWPDLKIEIQQIFGADDMVSCYAIDHGTSLEYHRSAVWSEMDLFRLRDGRIIELWSVENALDELTQLGFQITEPVRELG